MLVVTNFSNSNSITICCLALNVKKKLSRDKSCHLIVATHRRLELSQSADCHCRVFVHQVHFFSMENVSKIWLGPLPQDSPYVKPFRLYYVQNGVEKNWDLLKVHDSVAIILYNTSRQKLVLVRQFRPAVYHGIISSAKGTFDEVDLKEFPPAIGVTLELCAGIVDKNKSWVEIAREEVVEECGYDVPVERIEEVMVYR